MFNSIILLLPLLVLVTSDESLHDGPCPTTPEPQKNLNLKEIFGVWRLDQDNYEVLKTQPIECAELDIQVRSDGNYLQMYYIDSKSELKSVRKKFIAVDNEPGRWISYSLNETTGESTPDGWVCIVVKVIGNAEGLLEYQCREIGNKHQSYYRMLTRSFPIKKEIRKMLVEAYEATGDKRQMSLIKSKNCKWQLK